MATMLRQSTAVTIRLGPALDKTDGVTEETAISPSVEVSRNHGAFAARNSATAITHDSNAWFAVPLDTTDTGTLGPLIVKFDDSATHLPVWREFLVVPANVYDSLVGGTDSLEVDTTAISGDSAAADNLEAAADGTGYNLGGGSVVAASVTADPSGVTTLLSRLSSARAGYLDNLSAGAVALASALTSAAADVTTLLGRLTSTRAGYLDNLSSAPPTGAAIADAVWDEALSGHATSGTAGHYLTDAGSGADPMENAASGYASGTLGYIISRLTSARVTVSSFLSDAGDMTEIVAGADYNATDGTSFDWTQDTGAWPDLTAATVVWHGVARDGTTQTYTLTVTDATGATKAVRLELTAAQTQALADASTGIWQFAIWATLSSGRKVRLVQGSATVVDSPGPS